MNRRTPIYGIALIAVGAIFWSVACTTSSSAPASSEENTLAQLSESEDEVQGKSPRARTLTLRQIEGFEREIWSQYRNLDLHYQDYDKVLKGVDVRLTPGEEHRLHRKMKRRHLTLARLHEDRIGLELDGEAGALNDRNLAILHRTAASWHEKRFQIGGEGISLPDRELKKLRGRLTSERENFATYSDLE